MISQNTKSVVAWFGIFMFIIGIILMAVAEHIDAVFAVGFLLFLTSIMMALTAIIWRNAVIADKFFRKHLDGDSEK